MARKKSPTNVVSKSSAEKPGAGNDSGMSETLGGPAKAGTGAGYGTSSRAHKSRQAGSDPTFVFGPSPEPSMGDTRDPEPSEFPGAPGLGLPGRSMNVKPEMDDSGAVE
jgi:hypothetical protein